MDGNESIFVLGRRRTMFPSNQDDSENPILGQRERRPTYQMTALPKFIGVNDDTDGAPNRTGFLGNS